MSATRTPDNPLYRAATLIERRGWCRDRFEDEDGRVCLEMALLYVAPMGSDEARECVRAELAARGVTASVVEWNDQAAGGAAVVELLRAAAARWPGADGRASETATTGREKEVLVGR